MSDRSYMTMFAMIALILAVLALLTMEGCSGDATRGRVDLAPLPQDFCLKHPDDIACRGPKK
jgi:hypothetical protein